MRIPQMIVAALLATFHAAHGEDATQPLWKSVGDWEIRVDKTQNFGCFMVGVYTRGDLFRIGFDRTRGTNGYIVIGNAAWASLEEGKDYDLYLQFDNENAWHGTASAFKFQGYGTEFLTFRSIGQRSCTGGA